MSIEHHPTDLLLTTFAAGTLDHGQHVAIATHLVSCPQCRSFMRSMEHVGGSVLTSLPPAAMSSGRVGQSRSQVEQAGSTNRGGFVTHGARERGSWITEIRASLPIWKLEVDRAIRASAAHHVALRQRHASLFAQVRSRDEDA